jgi:hypothetical protein
LLTAELETSSPYLYLPIPSTKCLSMYILLGLFLWRALTNTVNPLGSFQAQPSAFGNLPWSLCLLYTTNWLSWYLLSAQVVSGLLPLNYISDHKDDSH